MSTKKKTPKKSATTKVAKTKKVSKPRAKAKPKAKSPIKTCCGAVPPPVRPPVEVTPSGREVDPSAKILDYLVIDDSGTGYKIVLRGKDLQEDEAAERALDNLGTLDFRITRVNGLQSLIATIFGATLIDLDYEYTL